MQLYEQILKLGHFKDEHKVLLHMQQGKATKGTCILCVAARNNS